MTRSEPDLVRELILRRARSHSRPGRREDGHTIGLCIEGGGMRGVVSAGMVAAIEQLGLLAAFDRVYGASAGALNGAYLVAGQAAYGTTIYYENINNRAFIDFTRLLRGQPIVDMDFLTEQVMVRDKPLDCDAVLHSPIPLSIIASSAETGDAVVLDARSPDTLRRALRAGATMPLVAGPPYQLNGQRLWDGSITEPIPTRIARADGCTGVVVLLTRPEGVLRPGISWFDRHVFAPRLARHSPILATRHLNRAEDYRGVVESLNGQRPFALPIRAPAPIVSKLEKRAERLRAGAAGGMQAVLNAFAGNGRQSSPA